MRNSLWPRGCAPSRHCPLAVPARYPRRLDRYSPFARFMRPSFSALPSTEVVRDQFHGVVVTPRPHGRTAVKQATGSSETYLT